MRRLFSGLLAGWASVAFLALAQTTPLYTVTTIAGIGRLPYPGDGRAATSVTLFEPNRVAYDRDGNLYFTETYYHRVFRVSTSGILSVVAGNGAPGFSGDGGLATRARLDFPTGVAVDSAGNVFIASGLFVRRVSPNGVISTIAGNGSEAFSGDGDLATRAGMTAERLAIDSAGRIYVSDRSNRRIRRLDPVQIFASGVLNGATFLSGAVAPVPYSVAGKSSTVMQVTYRGRKTNTVTLPVADSSPWLFAVSGRGQAAVLNQDWSVNSAGNPAARDTIIMLYATGEGQTIPGGVDGKQATEPYPAPVLPVSVTIGGLDAEVLYAAAGPFMVAGAMQVNVRVPATAPAGDTVPIRLKVGNNTSRDGVTVAIR